MRGLPYDTLVVIGGRTVSWVQYLFASLHLIFSIFLPQLRRLARYFARMLNCRTQAEYQLEVTRADFNLDCDEGSTPAS